MSNTKDPLGIDMMKPRLGWLLQSDQRGQKQTAYRVLVASTVETLAKDQCDLRDSGHRETATKPTLSRDHPVSASHEISRRNVLYNSAIGTAGLTAPDVVPASVSGKNNNRPAMRKPTFTSLLSTCLLLCSCLPAAAAELPGPVVPDGLGVNIHFIDPKPGEMEMLAQAGFRWIRMDFVWGGTEREKGIYDFTAYDRLMAALEAHHIRAVFILDYGNPHYNNGLPPVSAETNDEVRKAFARWAVAAAHHFRNRGVLWEMYNEPPADPKPYIKLALEVGKALREAEPGELYIGPAVSSAHDSRALVILEECFKAGLLEYWSGVSVHPYRGTAPETVTLDYDRLRKMIDQYASKGKVIPILSGEWGYPSNETNETKQGKLLPRMYLMNLANHVPFSIWYDWHNDGPNPAEREHNFGTVRYPYFRGRTPVYDPKPAYLAAQTLTRVLSGYRFQKRLPVGGLDDGGLDDYVMRFTKGNEVCLVAWTTAASHHTVVIPAPPGRYTATGHTGQVLPTLVAKKKGFTVVLSDAPMYLVPER